MQAYLTEIEQIIDRSRREEEAFLVDSKTAAERIVELLIAAGFEKVVYLKVA